MTIQVLADTCAWLALAEDYRQRPVISALEQLVKDNIVELIVPQIVLDEFDRNKPKVIDACRRSLQSQFRQVREAVSRFGKEEKSQTLKALQEIDHTINLQRDAVTDALGRVEQLLRSASPLPTTDTLKLRAVDRAIEKRAPFHGDKNSINDAVLIEIYARAIAENSDEGMFFAFVTHNFKDFSEVQGDRRKPHADIASLFASDRSTYWLTMADLLRYVDSDTLLDHAVDFDFNDQPRSLTEILEAEHLLMRQVWYNRHCNRRVEIEDGSIQLVSKEEFDRHQPIRPDQIVDTVWAGALAAAKRTEEEIGLENLGPWDDFEWGMINGKLSALRWVIGLEWDELYT